MKKQIFLLLFLLIKQYGCHTGKNSSDVIVINTGHADADANNYRPNNNNIINKVETKHAESTKSPGSIKDPAHSSGEFLDEKEDAVFIPNDRDTRVRPENTYYHDETPVRVQDVMGNRKTVNDILTDRRPVDEVEIQRSGHTRMETESPPEIMFISGKNNEYNDDTKKTRARDFDENVHMDTRRNLVGERPSVKKKGLDCSDLDCNNTVSSVCGGKMENKQMKYRLFLNDCYFRKVNCGFKYESSRYQVVLSDNCIKIAGHYSQKPERPYYFKPILRPGSTPDAWQAVTNPTYRRSLHVGLDGIRCTHPCPNQCTNDYDPQCAVTPGGAKRVFINHCKLDYNSCFNGILWHRRPMAECVGWQKAEMHQNRGFINWMQRKPVYVK